MKKAVIAILLAAMFAISFTAFPAMAWFYPGNPPSDDYLHNQFGPMTQNLLITPYGGVEAEFLAYLASDVDFMDWPLLASQKAELDTLDPDQLTFARAFFVDRGMREFDLNLMRFPCDNLQFRKALAHSFDKATFISTQLAGLGLLMDTPLQWSSAWANPYCTGLYPYDLVTAAAILDAAGFVDSDTDGWREGPAAEEIILQVYIRQDDPDRTAMGLGLCANLESIGIECNELVVPKTECFQKVMVEFDYDVYTGGWSMGRDPDILYFLYLGAYAQAFPYTPNYPGYNNPTFDFHAEGMLTAAAIGDEVTPSTAKYHVMEMQRLVCDDVAVIPVFTYASYGSYKVGWEKVCNVEGTGPWGWYSLLNTYKTGTDTIRWAFMNDIEGANVMHSEWVWDWQILDKVYDALINVNPYDVTDDQPWMAKSWELGEWDMEGSPASYIRFHLREDMYWHDVPVKADRVTPGGAPLLVDGAFDVPVTGEDVRFSIYAVRDIPDSWNNALVADVVYCDLEDPYTVTVYFGIYMPLWALHWVGGLPIMPKHVWEPVFLEDNTREFDPIAQECLVGCGPWVYDYAGSSMHNYYLLTANTRYFRYHPIDLTASLTTSKIVQPCTDVHISVWLHNMDQQRIVVPPSEYLITLEVYCAFGADIQVHLYDSTWVNVTIVGGWTLIVEVSNPELVYCDPIKLLNIYMHVDYYCAYEFKLSITPDPLTGHGDADGYSVYLWSTKPEDINLDFFVNAKDAVKLGGAFGTQAGNINFYAEADINGDGFVNAKDAVLLGTQFGWNAGCP